MALHQMTYNPHKRTTKDHLQILFLTSDKRKELIILKITFNIASSIWRDTLVKSLGLILFSVV